MKLKNTDELRRRAKAHERMDNFLAGTYGSNAEDGDPNEIEACGVGCLAAPHQKGRFAALMAKIGVQMWAAASERERLAKEFGICEDLTWVIENGFEYGGGGGNSDFVVAVTEAMADGVNIRPYEARRWQDPVYSTTGKVDFILWLAKKCGRPIPAYARGVAAI